jgi:uncharacterized OsmC-like protein
MPVKMGAKKYKKFGSAAKAIAKKKGIPLERAKAYVAATERAQGKDPRTGKKIKRVPTSKQKKTKRKKK